MIETAFRASAEAEAKKANSCIPDKDIHVFYLDRQF